MDSPRRAALVGSMHLDAIQAGRGLAALLVLFHHAAQKSERLTNGGMGSFDSGAIGVDVFFLISGFIIYHVTVGRTTTRFDYFARRLLRVFPMYWMLSLVALAVYAWRPALVNSGSAVPTDIVGSFLLLPRGGPFLVNNGWTLTYEIVFYGLWGLFVMPTPRSGLVKACCSVLAAAALLAFVPSLKDVSFHFSLLFEFVLGVVVAMIFHKGVLVDRPWLGGAMIGLGLLACQLTADAFAFQSPYRGFLNALPALTIFVGVLLIGSAWRRLPWMTRIGDSSYSLYLFHPFVLGLIPAVANFFAIRSAPGMVALTMASCLLAIVCSWGVYVLLERPLTNGLRRLVP